MADGSHEGFEVGEDVDGWVVEFRVCERGVSIGALG